MIKLQSEKLISIVEKLKTPTWKITVPLFVLLGFLPIRILTLLCVDPIHRDLVFFLGLALLAFYSFFMNRAVPYLLNNMVVQFFFFCFLAIEDFVCSSSSRLFSAYLSFCITSIIFLVPVALFLHFGGSGVTSCLLVQMIALACYRLRAFFVIPSPNLANDMVQSGYLKPIEKPEDFDWSVVVFNMDQVSERLYQLPVANRLGSRLTSRPMRVVGARYMTVISKFLGPAAELLGRQAAEAIKNNPGTAAAAGATVGAGVGVSAYVAKRELDIKERELDIKDKDAGTRRIDAETNRLAAEKKAEVDEIIANTHRMEVEARIRQENSSGGWFASWVKKEEPKAPQPSVSMDSPPIKQGKSWWSFSKKNDLMDSPRSSLSVESNTSTDTKALSVLEESLFYKVKGYLADLVYFFFNFL